MELTVPVAITSAASLLKAPVQEFLSRISGPAGDEIGEWIRDKVHAFCAENAGRALTHAHAILAARGRDPREIPLRTLVPLLQGASLKNDPSLSEKWASLLAAAADPAVAETILPSFPRFLEFLNPRDAAFLDLL
jgi:Abortive infection alpha